jgi:CubicO group peptidase (beta-lactamase class C family)
VRHTTLVLADRGAFDLEAPVTSYWPEFRDGRVLVRHLLDGLVRAATGTPLAEQFRTLIATPLDADFHIGVPEDLDRRTTVAYAMNRLEGGYGHSERTDAYVQTAFACM